MASAKCGCALTATHIRPRSCYASATRSRMQRAPRTDISILSEILEDSQVLARARRAEIRERPLREQGAHGRLEIIDPNHVALNHVAHLAFRRSPCVRTVVQMLHDDICSLGTAHRTEQQQANACHGERYARTCVAGGPRCAAYGVSSTQALRLAVVAAHRCGHSPAATSRARALCLGHTGSEGVGAVPSQARPATAAQRSARRRHTLPANRCALGSDIFCCGIAPLNLQGSWAKNVKKKWVQPFGGEDDDEGGGPGA